MTLRRTAIGLARRLPLVGPVIDELDTSRQAFQGIPPGHYYSPIPALDEVRRDADRIFGPAPPDLPGIDLNEQGQLATLRLIARYYPELPFQAGPAPGLRYYFDNPMYSYSDAICCYGMLRHLRPRRVIEVGSGFSSALLLDVNQRFFADAIACTFIEPHPERLFSLLTPADRARVEVIPARLQDVDPARFATLGPNDILFIDSSHVLKVGSDVQQIINEVLPGLPRGVYVHFHDVIYPFEYPQQWIEHARYWTEAYALRAFLAFNAAFEIVLFNTYLTDRHRSLVENLMPLALENAGGSIWLRRVA